MFCLFFEWPLKTGFTVLLRGLYNWNVFVAATFLFCRFMLTPIPNIKSTLDMKVKAADAKIKTIEVCIYM